MKYINRYLKLSLITPDIAGFAGSGGVYNFNADWKITFNVRKSSSATFLSFNEAEISIWNMTERVRRKIAQAGCMVVLDAGYEKKHGQIFNGLVSNIVTTKNGPDIVTTLYCMSDQAKYYKPIEQTARNVAVKDLIVQLCKNVGASYQVSHLQELAGQIVNRSYSGPFSKVIAMICADYKIYVGLDNGFLDFRDKKETAENILPEDVRVFTPNTGMIGNPQVTETGVDIKNLIVPDIRVNDYFKLQADYAAYNLSELTRTPNKVLGGELNAFQFIDTHSYNGIFMALSINFMGDTRGNEWSVSIQGSRIWNKNKAEQLSAGAGPQGKIL